MMMMMMIMMIMALKSLKLRVKFVGKISKMNQI